MPTKKPVVWIVVAVALMIPWVEAAAATVEAMTLDDMARRAEMIVIGRVVGSHADWNDQRTRVYTYTTLEVERYLKGGGGERAITIRVWGGQVGPYRAVVPGAPQFEPGEQVLLFCAGTRARVPTVLGLALGKFTLTTNAAGERVVKRDISGLILTGYRTDSRPVGVPPTQYRLADVESRIQAALND